MDFKGTRGKWKHKKGKRAKFEYDNFIIDEYGNHIVKWSNTGNGSHKLTIKESHANGLLISKSPILLQAIYDSIEPLKKAGLKEMADYHEKIIKEATEL